MFNNDKYSANSTSIFVPIQYKHLIEAVVTYQNTQQSASNSEFIAAIECSFGFSDHDDNMLLVTTQYGVFKGVLQKLLDPALLLAFMLDMELPQVDDDTYIKSAVAKQELSNVWYCNDWLLPVPLAVHHKADGVARHYATDLLCITPVASDTFVTTFDNNGTLCYQQFLVKDDLIFI